MGSTEGFPKKMLNTRGELLRVVKWEFVWKHIRELRGQMKQRMQKRREKNEAGPTARKVSVGHTLRWASDGRIHSRVSKARALCLRAAGGSPLVSRHIGPLWSGTAAGRELFGHNPAHGDAAGEAYQCGIRAEGGQAAQRAVREWPKHKLVPRNGVRGCYMGGEEGVMRVQRRPRRTGVQKGAPKKIRRY